MSITIHPEWLTFLVKSTDPDLEPAFAYASAVNWIRGLAMLVENGIADPALYVRNQVRPIFGSIGPTWPPGQPADETHLSLCLTPLFMAANFANTLDHLAQTRGDRLWSTLPSAMVTWYYSVYYLFQGFIAAKDGITVDTHAQAQRVMNDKSRLRLLLPPFSLQSIWGGKWKKPALAPGTWLGDGTFLRRTPATRPEAEAAVGAYFTGTWDWFAERKAEGIRRLNKLTNFRTKVAQQLRDAAVQNLAVNFLHCAYRYRTKGNYRDAIFTTYGSQFTGQPTDLLKDLRTIYQALSLGVEAYVCTRVHITRYKQYVDDVARHQRDKQALFPTRFQGPAVLAGMT